MESKIMRRIAAPLSLALLAGLGACGPVNRGMESVHQPLVSRSDYAMDVGISPAGLAPGEEARLAGWFDTLKLGYGDRISIDDPTPYGRTASHGAISGVAAHYGLLVSGEAPVTDGQVPANSVRVVVSRSSARVEHCPDWDKASQPNFAGSTSSNFGCATNSNLAAMVASPEDLVRGQESAGPIDARSASKAITAYRNADTTGKAGLTKESTKTGGN